MIALIIAAVVGITAIVVAFLNWDSIVGWFRNRQNLVQEDKNNIAIELLQRLEDGRYTEIHGIFNKDEGIFVKDEDGEDVVKKIIANDVDDTLKQNHREEELVILS
jgi:hypothetical protein